MELKRTNTSYWSLIIVVMICAALCEYDRVGVEFSGLFLKQLSIRWVGLLALCRVHLATPKISVITLTIKYIMFTINDITHIGELFHCSNCRLHW